MNVIVGRDFSRGNPLTAPQISLAVLREEFLRTGYCEIDALLAPEMRTFVQATAHVALERYGRRRDLLMPATGNSPRHYRLASRLDLLAIAPAIDQLYRSRALLDLLGAIADETVQPVPYEPEEYIATRFEREADTHGWHWDDYAFALVWVGCAPEPPDGGSLERIPRITWNKADANVAGHVGQNPIITRHPSAGTVYFLRSDTTLHRVTPLRRAVQREVACFSYASQADFARKVTHETIETLATGRV